MSRFAKGLLATALLGAALQVLVLVGGDARLHVTLISNILSICLAMLATASAIWAARVHNPYARWLWLLTALGFALLTLGELLRTYYDSVLHAPVHSVWPSDIFYFIFPVPMAMALLLRGRSRRVAGIHWAQCFDFLQIGILTASVYLYYFYLPSHWLASASDMELLQWRMTVALDIFLIVVCALRLTFVRTRLEWSLLSRLTAFLVLLSLGDMFFLHRQISVGLDAGSLWDLCYSAPILAAVVGACTWTLPNQPDRIEERADSP